MDRRSTLAIVVVAALVFVWMWRLNLRSAGRTPPSQPPADTQGEPDEPSRDPTTVDDPGTPGTAPSPAPPGPSPSKPDTETVPLRDDILLRGRDLKHRTVWTNRGGCLREARLTDYHQTLDSDEGVLLLKPVGDNLCSLMLKDPTGELPLHAQHYNLEERDDSLSSSWYEDEEKGDSLVFSSTFANGLKVIKEFTPRPGKYGIGVRITLANTGEAPITAQYQITSAARIVPEGGTNVNLFGAIGLGADSGRADDSRRVTIEKKRPSKKLPLNWTSSEAIPILWAGCMNRYFAAVLRPDSTEPGTAPDFIKQASIDFLPQSDVVKSGTGKPKPVDNVYTSLLTKPKELKPGETVTHAYTYFVGPKKAEVLTEYPTMTGLIDYGWFSVVSRFLLVILHFFYSIIPNYGIGIILLTILVKAGLHPLTRKSQFSMHKMQKLQPLVREIQEKYKDDRERQSKEMMALYKKGGNPMGGCFPIFFQLPVFIGLWRMLFYTIDLRHEGLFPFWIRDLAAPDTITHIGSFPVNILPILMVVFWIVQQLTMPKSSDPQQAQQQKMMLIMPIFFLFIMYSFAAGVTLYWTTSSILGIIEQRYIKHQIRMKEARGEFDSLVPEPEESKPTRARPRRR